MTSRLSPRRFHVAPPFAAVAAALSLLTAVAALPDARAQDPSPGTLDDSFVLTRVRDTGFIPTQSNFTPFAIALQPGQDPVQPNASNFREIPAAQTKLIIAGDGATLYRAFLTRTVRAITTYADGSDDSIPVGTPVTTLVGPFDPGDIDTTFNGAPFAANGVGNAGRTTFALSINADGGILAGGLFGPTALVSSVYRKQEKNFILLNFNGDTANLDLTDANGNFVKTTQGIFNGNLGAGANDAVLAILRRSTLAPGETDGRILLGGQFTRFNKQDRGRVTQVLPDGTADVNFNRNLGDGASGIVFSLAEAIDGNTGFANGQTYVCGDFDTFNGKGPGKLVRLNEDGTRDTTFTPKIDGRAIAVAVQPDGLVLLGGDLDAVNGTSVNNIARLFPDGSLDLVFRENATASLSIPNNIPPTAVYVLRVQPDGRILVGGNYHRLDGVNRDFLGRLNPDGTLDPSFNADGLLPDPTNANSNVTGIISNAIQNVLTVPRDVSMSSGTDFIFAQTRADRKQVSGDAGFFPDPVRRLFGDTDAPTFATFPIDAPLVRIGADGPTATVGDLTPRPDIGGDTTVGHGVPDPGTFGLFRITREGSLAGELTVRLKVNNSLTAATLNGAYLLRPLTFEPNSAGVVVPVLGDALNGPRFDATFPVGERTLSFLVVPLNDGIVQGDQTVTLKVKAAADGSSYGLRADQRAATITILANNR